MSVHTVVLNEPLLPLAFVGCWNREIAGEGTNNPRDRVAAAIQTEVREGRVSTVILGGDNEYPLFTLVGTTEEKQKRPKNGPEFAKKAYDVAYSHAFKRGAELYTGVPRLFMAVGNHNINPVTGRILDNQNTAFGDALPANYYKIKAEPYDIIVIDTNLVRPAAEYINQATKLKEMIDWLANNISDGKQYILVQHEPYAAHSKVKEKEKEGKKVQTKEVATLPNSASILDVIKENPPLAILCADTHNYQEGIIDISGVKIPQYVVGTGGAQPDKMYDVSPGEVFTRKDLPFKYIFTKHRAGYGYLRIDPGPSFTFVPIAAWRGGARRRTRRQRASRSRHTKSRHRFRG